MVGQRAYLADGYRGVKVFDVSQPTNVIQLGSFPSREAWKVRVHGSLAYVANGLDGLLVLDVSNSAQIIEVGRVTTGGYARDVRVAGSRIYLANGEWGLTVLEAPPQFGAAHVANGFFEATLQNLTGTGTLTIESSTNGAGWTAIQTNTITGREQLLSVPLAPGSATRLFRAQVR